MPVGPVITNNTPLISLLLLGKLNLLSELFGEVLIPSAVLDEFLASDPAIRRRAISDQPNLQVASLADPQKALAFVGLDSGESEVLALALERSARLVIVDERKARRYARRIQIPVTGTLGILLLAKEKGLLDSIAPPILALQQAGLYLHPSLVASVLSLAKEA